MKEPDILHVSVDLAGDMKHSFELLKQKRGIKNSTEMVRILIVEECGRRGIG